MKLTPTFYQRTNVVKIARELIGMQLFTDVNGTLTGGTIIETEAYSWKERGCHAYGGKMTSRNEVMFRAGGHAYVYLCYGMHHLFNVVTNKPGMADAILVRAIEPHTGIEVMRKRRGDLKNDYQLTSGPGKLTRALGIDRSFNGKFLLNSDVWIEDSGNRISPKNITETTRIGIDYAGTDATLPWRFFINGNKWISKV
jgi:DNA-3-methyladenine glycosylase